MSTQLKADLMLIMVAAFWGSSCLFTKFALEDMDEFNLTAVRFAVGFAAPAIFLFKKLKTDWRTIGYSALLGLNYFFVVGFMTFGLRFTSVSNAGFLTCLAGVFVPFICVIFLKMKLDKKTVFCAISTLFGVYLLTMGGSGGSLGINLGDVLCTLCSLFFAIHIILIGYVVKRADVITLTMYLMGFVTLYNLVAAFIFETPHLPTTLNSWFNVLWLGVVCAVGGALLQNMAQKQTSETHAGIIFTLEPVFAMMFAYAFLNELLTLWGYLGAAILFGSILLLEVDISKLR